VACWQWGCPPLAVARTDAVSLELNAEILARLLDFLFHSKLGCVASDHSPTSKSLIVLQVMLRGQCFPVTGCTDAQGWVVLVNKRHPLIELPVEFDCASEVFGSWCVTGQCDGLWHLLSRVMKWPAPQSIGVVCLLFCPA
jgi:hypothetical protein